MNKNRRYRDTVATTTLPDGTTKTKLFPTLKESLQMLVTFTLVVFGWIIFRATGMNTLTLWVSRIFDNSFFSVPWLMNKYFYPTLFMNIILLLIIEWINRESNHGLEITNIK
jgi:D-alanyl-lipoteichoic acid acyltransferase DltB (MBOAT superfamily)